MKWSITQLRKYQGKPFEFDQTVSFDNLKESLDLIDLSPITIQGQLTIKSTEVVADIHITGTYTMPCARTLVPVKVPLDVTTTEVFDLEGYNQYNDDQDDVVIIEKPMRAYSEQSDQMLTVGNGWEVIDEDQLDELAKQQEQDDSESRQVDPRLQKLQQLYDKEQ
ncbi:protein, clustered with ribosomal protein L32p [Staphylococcus aureus]|nr:protein, clustered with ribosomal protein L32p [Staphylococcus aureus]